MIPVDQNGLDFARLPGLESLMGGEKNGAAPHFSPLSNIKNQRSPSEVEVKPYKIRQVVGLRIIRVL